MVIVLECFADVRMRYQDQGQKTIKRADSRLDEDQWRDFFAEASKALAEVDYDGRYIVNMDETFFHQNFITM